MKIRDIRKMTGLSQREFANKYSIPLPTLQHWERDFTQPPKYFLQLIEESVCADQKETLCFKGKYGETYMYSPDNNTIMNETGDKLYITDLFNDVKLENAGLYLSELFDSIKQAKDLFSIECKEDIRNDIIWMEE